MQSYFTEDRPEVLPKVEADRAADRLARERLREHCPSEFDPTGNLSPNWKMVMGRKLERDWDAAVNRVLMGGAYRIVSKQFDCSVGLLHRKVMEYKDNYGGMPLSASTY